MAGQHKSVDDYIASQPSTVQPVLREIRTRIHAVLPGAGEMISYGIPTITIGGRYAVDARERLGFGHVQGCAAKVRLFQAS